MLKGIALDIGFALGHYPRVDTYTYSAASTLVPPPSMVFNIAALPFAWQVVEAQGRLNPSSYGEWEDNIKGIFEKIIHLRVGVSVYRTPVRVRVETKDYKRNRRVNIYAYLGIYRLWLGTDKMTNWLKELFKLWHTYPNLHSFLPIYWGRNSFPSYIFRISTWKGVPTPVDEGEYTSVLFYPYEANRREYVPITLWGGDIRWIKMPSPKEGIHIGQEENLPMFVPPLKRYKGEKENRVFVLPPRLSSVWATEGKSMCPARLEMQTSEEQFNLSKDRRDFIKKWSFSPVRIRGEKVQWVDREFEKKLSYYWPGNIIFLSPPFEMAWIYGGRE